MQWVIDTYRLKKSEHPVSVDQQSWNLYRMFIQLNLENDYIFRLEF